MRARSSRTAAGLAAAVGLMLLSACSGEDTQESSPSPPAAASSAAPSAVVRTVGFDETYRTDDGLEVKVTNIKEDKFGPIPPTDEIPDAKEGDPFVVLVITTTNKTKASVEFVPEIVVTYGPEKTPAGQVLVDDISSTTTVEPDKAFDYAVGFTIPPESYDQVVLEMTMTIDPLRTAVFSGSVTPT